MNLVDLTHNDTMDAVAQKCNRNFKQLGYVITNLINRLQMPDTDESSGSGSSSGSSGGSSGSGGYDDPNNQSWLQSTYIFCSVNPSTIGAPGEWYQYGEIKVDTGLYRDTYIKVWERDTILSPF